MAGAAEPSHGDTTPNGTAPWYARFGLHLLTQVAPWTLLSGVLIALVTGWLPFPVLAAFVALRDDVAHLTRLVESNGRALDKLARIEEHRLDIARATCWNTSKTADDQRRCYRPTSGENWSAR